MGFELEPLCECERSGELAGEILSERSESKDLKHRIGGADGIRIRQLYGNKGVLRCNLAF
jgi:hypothetical protein